MREILFRAKRHKKYCKSQEWTEGVPFVDRDGDIAFKTSCTEYIVNPETIGEYTGKKDKNDKKIFEGDIVKSDGRFHVVRFGAHQIDCCGCCYNSHHSIGFYLDSGDEEIIAHESTWEDLCVIGNIHDNPELLKGGAE